MNQIWQCLPTCLVLICLQPITSDPPELCQIVVVCNAGLTTGASRESILERFLPHAPARSVHMAPGRQFCFVQFDDPETARRAVTALDGVQGPEGGPPLYLAYTEQGGSSAMVCLVFWKPGSLLVVVLVVVFWKQWVFCHILIFVRMVDCLGMRGSPVCSYAWYVILIHQINLVWVICWQYVPQSLPLS